MTTGENQPAPDADAKRARRLKTIGVIVLTLGVVSAAVVYGLGLRKPDLSDDVSLLPMDKAASHQMGLLYGSSGRLMDDLTHDLHQPGVQAVVILVVAVLIAAVFFLFARLPPSDPGDDIFKLSDKR